MEKWAAGNLLYKNFIQAPRVAFKSMVRGYRQTANDPGFKLQKNIARGVLGTGAAAYGLHQITKAPKLEQMASTYKPPM